MAGLAKAKEAHGKGGPSQTNGKKGNEHIPHPDKVVGYTFPVSKYQITPQAVALYNLAIGAARNEPTDPSQLRYVYENSDGTLRDNSSFLFLLLPPFTSHSCSFI